MAGGSDAPPPKKFKPNIPAVDRSKLKKEREALPTWGVRQQLVDEIKQHKTIIVIGETGSGKSTQIPQFCNEAGVNGKLIIGVTQPRRVAAVTLANRVANEMDCEIGTRVGYNVRFENTTSAETTIAYVTDGMLLREALHDPLLKRYSLVVIDEAHERTLHTDIMFGVVKRAQKERSLNTSAMLPQLKLVVMSATMDVDAFSAYFDDAPVYFIEGRTYPVEMFYASKLDQGAAQDYVYNSLVTLLQLHKTEPVNDDMLVFLTGQEEIESAVRRTREISRNFDGKKRLEPIALYAAMAHQAQMKAFLPARQPNTRKVIFATNIAETSLTIPGIRIVIDSGKVKMRSYQAKSRIDLLRVASVSQAQACQRAGRAGREAPGKCYRLYSEKDFDKFTSDTQPEIERCSVSSVVLELLRMGVSDVMSFDFMKAPSQEALKAAIRELRLLGAIEDAETNEDGVGRHFALTDVGQLLVAFPIDPKLAKVLVAASDLGCLEEALTVVAALTHDTIFVTHSAKRAESSNARRKFEAPEGDHVMLLKVYRSFAHVKKTNDKKALRDWCQENFVQERVMQTIVLVRSQLRATCVQLKLTFSSCGNELDKLRKALCCGLFVNACDYDPSADGYKLLDSSLRVKIHPSSCLSRSKPTAIIFTQLIMTAQLYASYVTVVDPDWVKDILEGRKVQLFAS
uniref:RNA helicase n=1 Tax=Plectus sambesii TaxID=2011161 RepID=A0A914WND7_9BILA